MSLLDEILPMANRCRAAACALVVALAAFAVAMAQEPPAITDEYLLQKWEVDDGLPDNTVTAILQTHDGYLWIGTSRGLARFDGVRFRIFNGGNTPELGSANIRCLCEDKNGALWIATDPHGVVRWSGGSFNRVPLPESEALGVITSLAADAEGSVWAGLSGGMFQWQTNDWRRFGERLGLSAKGAVTCQSDVSGKIWFTTETSCGFLNGTNVVTLINDAPFPQLEPRRAGGFWLARGNVLLIYKENAELLYGINMPWRGGGPEIQVLHEDRKGTLWIGTKGQGLWKFDGEFSRVATSQNFITAIQEDSEGNLWIGTGGGGLDRLRLRGLYLHNARNGMPVELVSGMCEDSNGTMWFAARNAGLLRFAEGRFSLSAGVGGFVTSVCADGRGGMWLGTLADGLLHHKDGKLTGYDLKGEHIESLLQDRSGTLWIGTSQNGLAQLRGADVKHFPFADGLRDISALCEDSAGAVWVGTRNGSLHRFSGGDVRHFDVRLPVQTILADGGDSLWLGTCSGLVRFQQGRISQVGVRQGLADDDVRQILADDAGNLWIGSLRGLFRVSRADLDEVASGRRASVECVTYGRGEGLGKIEFIDGSSNASCRTRDGRLWFATRAGVVEVNPALLTAASAPPRTAIEDVFLDGKALTVWGAGPFTIPPHWTKLDIRYAAPSFAAPEKVRFRYRLEGADKNWTEAGTERMATFLRIPPGRYRFHVAACNAEGRWAAEGATLEFTVQPSLWQSLWFRALAAIVGLALVAGIARFVVLRRVRRRLRALEAERTLEAERARIAQDMHDDLGARLTRIALLSEAARTDPLLPPESAARAEKISRAANETSRTLDEIVWTVNPGNDSLERLIGYLSEYAAEFLASSDIELVRELPENAPECSIAPDVRHNLLLAVKEALNNAVKHSQAKKIVMRLELEPRCLRVRLSDDGKGFDSKEKAAGEGLASMRRRLAAIRGECVIESQPGKGTTVRLSLPLLIGK